MQTMYWCLHNTVDLYSKSIYDRWHFLIYVKYIKGHTALHIWFKKILIIIEPYQFSPFSPKSLNKLCTLTSPSLWGKNNLICKNQFEFRPNHSTQHAVISLVNNITNRLDSCNIVI